MSAGLAVNNPGTSVQISQRPAPSLAAKVAAEVSEPPRPRSTVAPSRLRAMKPWVRIAAAGSRARRGRRLSARSKDGPGRPPPQPRTQLLVALVVAGGGQVGTGGVGWLLVARQQGGAGVEPGGGDAAGIQVGGAEPRREQLAAGHHASFQRGAGISPPRGAER